MSKTDSRRARTRKGDNPQREKLTIYVSSDVAARIRGRAEQEKVSISEIGEQLLNRAVLERAESDWWAYAGARVSGVVRQEIKDMSDRLANLIVRGAIDAATSRNMLVANIADTKGQSVASSWLSAAEQSAVDRLKKPSQGVKELINGET